MAAPESCAESSFAYDAGAATEGRPYMPSYRVSAFPALGDYQGDVVVLLTRAELPNVIND